MYQLDSFMYMSSLIPTALQRASGSKSVVSPYMYFKVFFYTSEKKIIKYSFLVSYMWSSEEFEHSMVKKQPSESPFFFAVNSLCCAIKAVRKVCSFRSTLMDCIFVENHVNKLLIISFCDSCRCNRKKGLLEGCRHLLHIAQGGLAVNRVGLKASNGW